MIGGNVPVDSTDLVSEVDTNAAAFGDQTSSLLPTSRVMSAGLHSFVAARAAHALLFFALVIENLLKDCTYQSESQVLPSAPGEILI